MRALSTAGCDPYSPPTASEKRNGEGERRGEGREAGEHASHAGDPSSTPHTSALPGHRPPSTNGH